MSTKKRKWSEEYEKFGFTVVLKDGMQVPQCLYCNAVLGNDSLRPNKLSAHRNNVHPGKKEEKLEDIQAKRKRFDAAGRLEKFGFRPEEKPALDASYEVAYLIGKSKKPHTIGETLIKPCIEVVARLMCGADVVRRVRRVALSDNSIQRRIGFFSQDIRETVCDEIRNSPSPASLQLDESTDVTNMAQLLAYVRYVHEAGVKEEFLLCEALKETTTAVDIKRTMDAFLEANGLSWNNFGHICTDGAPAMLGKRSGFVTLVKQDNPTITTSHCMLHRYALASKTLPACLMEVLDTTVKMINFVRSRALNHRIFQQLAEEMGAEHLVLLYHTNVRWLSRGLALSRVFELRMELEIFLREKKSPLENHFSGKSFVASLAYLADIFSHLNTVNKSMQGRDMTMCEASEKVAGLREKLSLWQRRIEQKNFTSFDRLKATDVVPDSVCNAVKDHLTSLREEIDGYFPDEPSHEDWYRNPFNALASDDDIDVEELLDLKQSHHDRDLFNRSETLAEFWTTLEGDPGLQKRAHRILLPFATSYLCESGFSAMAVLKTKQRNRLEMTNDVRVALSVTKPDIKKIVASQQEQEAH